MGWRHVACVACAGGRQQLPGLAPCRLSRVCPCVLSPPPPAHPTHPPPPPTPHRQVKRGIHWLAAPRQEHLRLAGVLLLRELAEAAPAIFNVHVRAFIEVVWNPLRDSRQHVREAAVAALRACLVLVEKRETRYRVQWYYRLFEETQRGLTRVTSLETVHGSLLALGELLRHTGARRLGRGAAGRLRGGRACCRVPAAGCQLRTGREGRPSARAAGALHGVAALPTRGVDTAAASRAACPPLAAPDPPARRPPPAPPPRQASSCWRGTARCATPSCASATPRRSWCAAPSSRSSRASPPLPRSASSSRTSSRCGGVGGEVVGGRGRRASAGVFWWEVGAGAGLPRAAGGVSQASAAVLPHQPPPPGHRVPAVGAVGARGARRRLCRARRDGGGAGARGRGAPHEGARRLSAPAGRRHQGVPGGAGARAPALPRGAGVHGGPGGGAARRLAALPGRPAGAGLPDGAVGWVAPGLGWAGVGRRAAGAGVTGGSLAQAVAGSWAALPCWSGCRPARSHFAATTSRTPMPRRGAGGGHAQGGGRAARPAAARAGAAAGPAEPGAGAAPLLARHPARHGGRAAGGAGGGGAAGRGAHAAGAVLPGLLLLDAAPPAGLCAGPRGPLPGRPRLGHAPRRRGGGRARAGAARAARTPPRRPPARRRAARRGQGGRGRRAAGVRG